MESGEKLVIINVYAPNNDDPQFFLNVFKFFEQYEGKRIVIGDFNTAIDCELDRSNASATNNDKAKDMILQYMTDTLMTDI